VARASVLGRAAVSATVPVVAMATVQEAQDREAGAHCPM
tara:strand:- start:399 stop:515 length:117 start_codon:yes stop_codon:yes gene_type:complete